MVESLLLISNATLINKNDIFPLTLPKIPLSRFCMSKLAAQDSAGVSEFCVHN